MLPLLTLVADQQEHTLKATVAALSAQFDLTDEERQTLLSSGQQTVFANRVGWAQTYLKKAGLLESPRRGVFHITPRGLDVLRQSPVSIDDNYLSRFPEFADFKKVRTPEHTEPDQSLPPVPSQRTPEEELEDAYRRIRTSLAADLLAMVRQCTPERFERLVVDLLIKMGYGGTREDAGEAIGRSGDGGIDGIIKEDPLGLDTIYLQAKRWDASNGVGRPEIQRFAGALQGRGSKKGVFITTSFFTREAYDYARTPGINIVLIDGERLVQLMIDHGLGVTVAVAYAINRIDSDYFLDDD